MSKRPAPSHPPVAKRFKEAVYVKMTEELERQGEEEFQPGDDEPSDDDGSRSPPRSPESADELANALPDDPIAMQYVQPGARIIIKDPGYIKGIVYIAGGDPAFPLSARSWTRPGQGLVLSAGGVRVTATLGPAAYRSMNSDADRQALPAIVDAEAAYSQGFKAGHLLNAEFGGPGNDPGNLTILTNSANSANRTFDNRIKDAVTGPLEKAYRCINDMGLDASLQTYGIAMTIAIGNSFWSTNPAEVGYLIADTVTWSAQVVGVPTQANLEAQLTAAYQGQRVGNHQSLMDDLTEYIKQVQGFVDTANANGVLDNT